jgi:hypothetical protein
MSAAILGWGSTFATGDGNSPETFTSVGETSAITLIAFTADAIDTSHEQPPNSAREFLPGMRSYGQVQITFNLIPGSATETALFLEMANQPIRNRRIVTPDAKTLSFPAFIIKHDGAETVADKLSGAATFQVTGAMTLT